MNRVFAACLLATVFLGLSVIWTPDRWSAAVAQVGICSVAAVWACHILVRGGSFASTPLALPLIGLLCWGAMQLAFGWTVSSWQTSEALLYWSTNLLALIVASSLAHDPSIARFLLRGLFVGGVILSFTALLQNFTSDGYAFWLFRTPYREDVWGPFLSRNQYAAFVELLLPIACFGGLDGRRNAWAYRVIAAGLLGCIVAAASRAGIALAAAELLAIPAILWYRRTISLSRLATGFLPLLVLGVIFALIVGPELVWTRLHLSDPYFDRRDMTASSLLMVRDRPVTGFGLGTWATVYPKYATTDDGLIANQAHNDWVQSAAETGIPGFLCFTAVFLWTVRTGWRHPWAIGLASVLLHALVDYPIQRQALGVFFFFFAGAISGPPKEMANESLHSPSETRPI